MTRSREESALSKKGYAPAEEIPVLLELAAEPSPVAVRLRFALHDDPRERGRIVGKDVARVEQLLMEELMKAGKEGKVSLLWSLQNSPPFSRRLTSRSFSFVKRHSFVHVLRKLSWSLSS